MALHNALVAMALGNTGDIDLVSGSEGISLHHIANVHISGGIQLKLLQVLLCLDPGLLQMAKLRLAQLLFRSGLEAKLDGGVAVGLDSFLLSDDAGACFHDGNRDHLAALIEDLGHAHFLADDCFLHGLHSPF